MAAGPLLALGLALLLTGENCLAGEPIRAEGIRCLYWASPMKEPELSRTLDHVLNLDYVSGVDIYVKWSNLEPSEGVFSWSVLDTVLQRCAAHGKSASFGILTSAFTPKWVMQKTTNYTFEHRIGWRISPVPWDPFYQKYLANLVAAMGKRYDGNPNLYYVAISGPSTLFGIEMCWPMKPRSFSSTEAAKLDFSLDKYEAGWKGSVDLFLGNFHKTPLSLALNNEVDYSGVEDSRGEEVTKISQEVRDYALQRYAEERGPNAKMIVQLLGLTPNNPKYFPGPSTKEANLNPYVKLVWDVRNRAIIGLESMLIWNKISERKATPFRPSAIVQLLNNGLSYDAAFIKIKTPDLIDMNTGQVYQPYAPIMQRAGQAFREHMTSLPPTPSWK